jgi:twitching motility protein PilT
MISLDSLTMQDLIRMTAEANASDLMIKAGARPNTKRYDVVKPLDPDLPILDARTTQRLMSELMTERQKRIFEETLEMDIGFTVEGLCRVRCNIYMQRGTWASTSRVVPLRIKSIAELGLPPILGDLSHYKTGLILVTGPTGSGKTTTLAAMLDLINKDRACNLVTIEDPIEFVHFDQKASVTQREVGIDTMDFQPAMRAALRQAPDVILIGEMRDVATMSIALQAGETGHFVFSTVHTSSAYETLDRVINMFPPHEKGYLCQRMGGSLRAIIAQKLIPRADGEGRVAALEILICTPTVTKKIEDGHFSDLYPLMNEGEFWGMQTMNQSLVRYVKAGIITEEVALKQAGVVSELKQMLRR